MLHPSTRRRKITVALGYYPKYEFASRPQQRAGVMLVCCLGDTLGALNVTGVEHRAGDQQPMVSAQCTALQKWQRYAENIGEPSGIKERIDGFRACCFVVHGVLRQTERSNREPRPTAPGD
jgi:hypothetical protein